MKKFTSLLIIFLIVSSITFPSPVSAAWWNPFSWFRPKLTAQEPVRTVKTTETTMRRQIKEAVVKQQPSIDNTVKQSMKILPIPRVQTKISIRPPIASASSGIKDKIPYIVQIVCPIKDGSMSGTGEIIYGNSGTNNQVITNKHVLNGAVGPCNIYRTSNYEKQPTLFFESDGKFIFSSKYDLAVLTPNTPKLTIRANTNVVFGTDNDLLDKAISVLGYPASAGDNITLTRVLLVAQRLSMALLCTRRMQKLTVVIQVELFLMKMVFL